ncbi:MAG: histidine triad nucleotide-binding protein [Treponema sp.]|jgi:histidine triad (HIT) family protein|nr:histidine triad nucleotide-binding protein [Treponema sp.]
MGNCLFCKIIAGEIPSTKLYEDNEMLAFLDINPMSPVHFLVIPKKHISNLFEVDTEDAALLGRILNKAQELAKTNGCEEEGGRFIINTKSDGGQTVDHLHIHFLGGRKLGWPPG